MQQPGSIANIVPPKDQYDGLLRMIRDLQGEVAALRTARTGEAMLIGKGGITVKAPGSVKIIDATTGDVLAELQEDGLYVYEGGQVDINDGGHIDLNDGSYLAVNDGGAFRLETPANIVVVSMARTSIPDGSGRTQQTFALFRDDGSPAMILSDLGTTPGHTHHQALATYDRGSNALIAEDTTSGQGLARPYLSFGAFMSNTYPTDTTNSGSFTTLQTLIGYKQHPKVFIQLLVRADDPGTAGEVQVIDQDGNVIGGVQTVPAGDYSYYNIGPTALPGAHMLGISLNIQARVTAGTGTIGVRGIAAWGQQT